MKELKKRNQAKSPAPDAQNHKNWQNRKCFCSHNLDIELVEFIKVPNMSKELTQKDRAMLKCLVRKRIFELENQNYNADTKELRILLKKLED